MLQGTLRYCMGRYDDAAATLEAAMRIVMHHYEGGEDHLLSGGWLLAFSCRCAFRFASLAFYPLLLGHRGDRIPAHSHHT